MLSESKLMIDRSEMVSVFRRLSLEAGEIVMKFYDSESFDIKLKADNSPVTAADKEADTHISRGILEYFSSVPLVTEEQVQTHTRKYKSFVIVDPLDGTKEFINRNGDFTVNIGLIDSGIPTLGVVSTPVDNCVWAGSLADGALRIKDSVQQKIGVRKANQQKITVVASRSHRSPELETFISYFSSTLSNTSFNALYTDFTFPDP